MPNQNNQTLEQKLLRLKEIQQTLESGSVPLTESMTLLEEALELKKAIEKELKSMENRLIDLTKSESDNMDFEV
jgi:exodeoxyribonuclease VII small subunit